MRVQDWADRVMLVATPQPGMSLAEARHRCTNYDDVLDSRCRRGYDLIYTIVKAKADRLIRQALNNPQQYSWS